MYLVQAIEKLQNWRIFFSRAPAYSTEARAKCKAPTGLDLLYFALVNKLSNNSSAPMLPVLAAKKKKLPRILLHAAGILCDWRTLHFPVYLFIYCCIFVYSLSPRLTTWVSDENTTGYHQLLAVFIRRRLIFFPLFLLVFSQGEEETSMVLLLLLPSIHKKCRTFVLG